MKNKKRNSGFTLVELLATLAILSLVVSIVLYFATGIINNTKEKAYTTTFNNILVAASNYTVENPELSKWEDDLVDTQYQYQCVSIEKLISMGYFKEDILKSEIAKDTPIKNNDYVYVKRDKYTKTITEKSYEDGSVSTKCGVTLGTIEFKINTTKSGKNVSITYKLNGNVNNATASYDYFSSSAKSGSEDFVSSRTKTLTLNNVTGKGTFKACIKIKTTSTETCKSIFVDANIPNNLKIELDDYNKKNNRTATLTMQDEDSGIKGYYFGKTDPSISDVRYEQVVNNKGTIKLTKEIDSAGTWYLRAIDVSGNYSNIVSITIYETRLYIKNATVVPGRILYTDDEVITLPKKDDDVIGDKYYTFNGWYTENSTEDSCVGTKYDSVQKDDPKELYGCVIENKFKSATVKINNTSPKYNDLLEVSVSDVEVTNPENDGDISYTYQWYYNKTNSKEGGTEISGATGKSYRVGSGMADKYYIYVEVRMKKGDNYREGVFKSEPTNKVQKANGFITLSASTGSITYHSVSSKTFSVIKYHGGALSVSDNSSDVTSSVAYVATGGGYRNVVTIRNLYNISPTTITVTVTSDATENYREASATYRLKINKAVNPVTVSAITGLTYKRGVYQQLVTTSNAPEPVYYSTSTSLTSSNYTSGSTTIPTKTNAGTYTVYWYALGNDNYSSKSGHVAVTIGKANGYVNLSSTGTTVVKGGQDSLTFRVINHHGGILSVSDNITTMGSSLSSDTITLTNLKALNKGSYTITVTSSETTNYYADSATYKLKIGLLSNPITVSARSLTYTGNSQKLVTVSNAQGIMYYSTTTSLTNTNYKSSGSTTIPTKTNAGTYTVYWYTPGNSSYEADSGHVAVTIEKAPGYIKFNQIINEKNKKVKFNWNGDIGAAGTWSVSLRDLIYLEVIHHGGTLTASGGGSATVKVSQNKIVEITNMARLGYDIFEYKVTVTSAATTNYTSARATYAVYAVGFNTRKQGYYYVCPGFLIKEDKLSDLLSEISSSGYACDVEMVIGLPVCSYIVNNGFSDGIKEYSNPAYLFCTKY